MTKKIVLLASLLALFCLPQINGQTAVKAEDAYVVLTYFSVAQENQAAYEELLNTTSKKFYTELMNQPGSNLWGWNISRIMYRGIHGNPATHIAAMIYNGPPSGGDNPAQMDSLTRKVSGMDPVEYRKKLNGLRKQLGSELIRGIAWTPANTAEGTYRVVTYAKAEPNKAAAYREQTRTLWQPVYAAAARDGKILGWSAWGYVFPRGGEAPYDLLTTMTFKDLPSAVRGYIGGATDFLKVHPNGNFVSAVDEVRGARKTGVTLVSRILAAAQKPVTRQ